MCFFSLHLFWPFTSGLQTNIDQIVPCSSLYGPYRALFSTVALSSKHHRCSTFAWKLVPGTLAWKLVLGTFRLEGFDWEMSLGSFRLGSVVWHLSLGSIRFGK